METASTQIRSHIVLILLLRLLPLRPFLKLTISKQREAR
jgi:hypothetical protein